MVALRLLCVFFQLVLLRRRRIVRQGCVDDFNNYAVASALALPLVIQNRRLFAQRDERIALTFGVILVTLVGQGLSLIPLIRVLNPRKDTSLEGERRRTYIVLARVALKRLQELDGQEDISEEQVEQLRTRYENELQLLKENEAAPEEQENSYNTPRNEIIKAQHHAILRLRDRKKIDDEVFREFERRLDLEDQRFSV